MQLAVLNRPATGDWLSVGVAEPAGQVAAIEQFGPAGVIGGGAGRLRNRSIAEVGERGLAAASDVDPVSLAAGTLLGPFRGITLDRRKRLPVEGARQADLVVIDINPQARGLFDVAGKR